MLKVARQLPRIRTSNPITKGLVFAYLPGTMVNIVRPHELARPSGGAGRVRNSLRMTGAAGNGLTFGNGALLGPLTNSTVVAIGTFGSGYRCIYGERSAGNEIYKLETGRLLNGVQISGVQFTYRNSGGTLAFAFSDVDLGTGPRLFAAIKTGGFHEAWTGLVGRPGATTEAYGTSAFGGDSSFSDPAVLRTHGYDAQDPDQPLVGTSDLLLGWNRSLTIAELQQIRANPEQLFDYPSLQVFSARAAAPVALSGSSVTASSSYGELTSAIPLAGAAQVVATGAAALSTTIRLTAVGTATTNAAGVLSTVVRLAGTAAAQSTANGTLLTAITLGAVASSRSVASGALATAIPLAASVSSPSTSSAALSSISTSLLVSSASPSSAAAALSTAVNLRASARTTASANAALDSGSSLSAVAVSPASARAGLATVIDLVAISATSGSANAALAVPAGAFSATAISANTARATLATSVVVSASAVATSSASADLMSTSPVLPNDSRTYLGMSRAREYVAQERIRELR